MTPGDFGKTFLDILDIFDLTLTLLKRHLTHDSMSCVFITLCSGMPRNQDFETLDKF